MPDPTRPTLSDFEDFIDAAHAADEAAYTALAGHDAVPPTVDLTELCAKLRDGRGKAQSLVSAYDSLINALCVQPTDPTGP